MANTKAVSIHAARVAGLLQGLRNGGAAPHLIQAEATRLLQADGIVGFSVEFPRWLPHPEGQRLQVAYWNGGGVPDVVTWLE